VVSPVPLILQDKEGSGSDIPHEEKVIFIFEESRPFAPINYSMKNLKNSQLQQFFRKERKKHRFFTVFFIL
jgi:hypothetical protein